MEIRKDNMGFTFIELVVSIAITSLVMLSLLYFVNSSTKNYRNASAEIALQTEAQLILNQISDIIIEAYNVKYDSANRELTIYQENKKTVITHDASNKNLLLTIDDTPNNPSDPLTFDGYLSEKYIEDFSVVDTGADNKNKQIKISITLKNDRYTYEIKDQLITLRNNIKPVS